MPLSVKSLIALQLLLGLGALYGGGLLALAPDGSLLGMPLSLLQHSPFDNFLIPGIILLTFLGFMPLGIAWALITRQNFPAAEKLNVFKDKHWAWTYSLYAGFATIIWITIQLYFIREAGVIHVVYIFWGLVIQILTLLPAAQRFYKL
jgi:hypothetical protein